MATSRPSAPGDISWDRLDKTKFLLYGVVSFSAVTTVLYPLNVIKTVQQAATEAQSTVQTSAQIWRSSGVLGFYRGYATVVFGTIPARVISLTSLEVTRSSVSKYGHQLGVPDATLAGTANFVAGGVSSLVTQLITVPRDVVSQRQMVATEAGPGAGTGGRGGLPGSGGVAAASWPVRGLDGGGRPRPRPTACPPGATVAQAAVQGAADVAGATATPAPASASSSVSTTPSSSASASCSSSSSASGSRAGLGPSSSGQPIPQSHPPSSSAIRPAPSSGLSGTSTGTGTLTMVRAILREEGVIGLYRGFGISIASTVPTSAVWWGSYGLFQQLIWDMLPVPATAPARDATPSASTSQSRSGGEAPPTTSAGSLQGLWGMFGASTASTRGIRVAAPSTGADGSAMAGAPATVPASWRWPWSNMQSSPEPMAAADSSAQGSSSGDGSSSSSVGGLEVVLVQTAASILAGITAAAVTTPLDLIRTRIQVARKQDGQATTFRGVVAEVLREEGWVGFVRGAAPRMLSSALWGTAMVTVYEWLKRVSVKE